jgi:Ca-activated chloride channel family protein
MAAEGTEGTLPRIEELTFTLDLERAHARDVRVGMSGKQVASKVIVKAYDLVPRADLSVELYDDGPARLTAYRAAHSVDRETVAADELTRAEKMARGEASYLLVPVRPTRANEPPGGLDLAIVIDTSAATDPASLAIARGAAGALLAHLGPSDRAAIWAGDASLRAVTEGSDKFAPVDEARRRAIVTGLARIDRGGATDLGAIVAEAASRLDVTRRGAVVYIGDGQPTVGELSVPELRERLGRLPRPVRLFGLGVGDQANLGILSGIARGGFAARVGDAHAAAETALAVLERAERPAWLGATADLGPGVDRVYPRELGALVADESAIVVGRVVGPVPARLTVHGAGGDVSEPLLVRSLDDGGDLRRRWAEARLVQLLDEGAGRAAVVEVGVRSGVITPFTSLYVPTAAEHAAEMGRASEPVAENGSKESWWQWLTRGGGGFGMSRSEAVKYVEVAQEKEGGTGTRAKGEEGSMGHPATLPAEPAAPPAAQAAAPPATPSPARPAPDQVLGRRLEDKKAPARDAPSNLSGDDSAVDHAERQKALRESMEFGMIGLLDKDGSPAPAASAAPNAGSSGDSFGGGGLGLSGTGEGGGGGPRGSGIGLGSIGNKQGLSTGAGAGSGKAVATHASSRPSIRPGAPAVSGRLPPEVIQRIVRQNFGRFRLCYEQGLATSPFLAGSVSVSFTIGPGGSVVSASDAGSNLADPRVVECIARSLRVLLFPAPEGGSVTVVYPMSFAPGAGFEGKDPSASLTLGQVGHAVVACSRSADLPLPERKGLWRERIAGASGNVDGIAWTYWRALAGCEAPTWRERSALLLLGVDSLSTIRERVALWRKFWKSPAAADVIYRAILTRVHTAGELRELHDALGMKHLDRALLAKALAERHTDAERLDLLRGLVAKWPDDLELALTLLDALEDARDTGEGRALARRLRRRSDATTRVRTSVGEYYLRLAATETAAMSALDTTEARRTFGEIVELSPDDPGARRLLGDLLRAHGWYEEALRQYETLERLSPDDAEVSLLLALAAEGLGRTEEAIRWTEKAAGAGAPDPTSALAKTSRAFASAFLAWARLPSPTTDDGKDQAARLRERARRLMVADVPDGKSVRFILTWSHPELHPELWSNGLGAPMPAADGDAGLGLAQALVPTTQADGFVEVRLAPEDADRAARLGASAVLTAITSEGEDGERIEKLPVAFAKVDGRTPEKRRFRVDGGALREVSL